MPLRNSLIPFSSLQQKKHHTNSYRSRAAFKLIQLNRQFGILDQCRSVLDLCAAPGEEQELRRFRFPSSRDSTSLNSPHLNLFDSPPQKILTQKTGGWLQVAAKAMPVSSLVVGVDLDKIKPIRGCKTLVGDITTPATAAALKRASGGAAFDAVLHDGAPNVGGAWSAEAYGQSALVLDAAKLAVAMLAPGGTFVTKVFRSKDYTALLYAFRQLFDRVDATKPAASRSTSAEIFVVCRGFKAPAKLDPRLLDARCLFVDGGAVEGAGGGAEPAAKLNAEGLAVEAAIGPAALLGPKGAAKRHRSGYDDGAVTLRRTAPAAAFVRSAKPVDVLGRYNAFVLEGPGSTGEASDVASGAPGPGSAPAASDADAAAVASHPATTREVALLAADLGVLGRSEFKALLKWRSAVRATLLRADKEALAAAKEDEEAVGGGGEEEKGDTDDKKKREAGSGGDESGDSEAEEDGGVLDEIADAKARADARVKKEKKRAREAKKKSRIRAAQLAAGEGVLDDGGAEGLFSLAAVRAGAGEGADALNDAPVPDVEESDGDDDKRKSRRAALQGSDSEVDSDDDDDSSERRSSRYELETERALDDAYGSYLERARGRRDATAAAAAAAVRNATERRGGKRAKLGDGAGELAGGDGESDGDGENAGGARAPSGYEIAAAEASDDDLDSGDDSGLDDGPSARGGGLLVPLSTSSAAAQAVAARRGTAAAADRWFGADPLFDADDEDDDDTLAAAAAAAAKARASSKRGVDGAEGGVARAPRTPPAAPAGGGALPSSAAAARNSGRDGDGGEGFEVVPGRASDGSDSDFPWSDDESDGEAAARNKTKDKKHLGGAGDEEEEDSDAGLGAMHPSERAEVLALARAALRGRRRSDIMDAGYNRYAFNDAAGDLPRWFADDERRHSRPPPLVTREEVAAEREAARGAAARPIKKVAQAKARKAHRLSVRLDAARRKAEAVAGNDELGARGKEREVEKIMSRARAGKGAKGSSKKQSRSATISGQKKAKPIDGRMRADMKRGKKGGGKGGKGKGGGGKKGKAGGGKGRR